MRNIENRVRAKDKSEVAEDAKTIYRTENKEKAEENLKEFLRKWSKKYPKLKKLLEGKDNLFTFMSYPRQIRKSLYTNNICENFNKNLKKKIKPKIQFPNEDSLDKSVYTYVSEYNAKFTDRVHIGFGQVRYELEKKIEELKSSSTRN
jgi:putative transposase